MSTDEELDNLFRKELGDPVDKTAFREGDWDAMEQMLNKGKKRLGVVYWLPILSSAAAVILIVLGWLFFKPEVVKPQHRGRQMAKITPHQENTGTSGGPTRQPTDSTKKIPPADYANNLGVTRHGPKNKSFFIDTLSAAGARRNVTGLTSNTKGKGLNNTNGLTNANDSINAATVNRDASQTNTNIVKSEAQILASATTSTVASADTGKAANYNLQAQNAATAAADSAKKYAAAHSKPGKPFNINGPQNHTVYALGVIASSDLNGVNSLSQSRVGGNFGLTFSATFKKWTISTGAAYAIKPYSTGADNYHTNYTFANEPVSVSANCRMIDIPLNVNYQVFGKHNNKITVGSGLSSYIILREDYTFNYASPNTLGPTAYSVINKNRNILGILNFDATYQHQVNSKVGVTLQPFLKLPLSNVGASQVRLQTAGVAVGVSWNLNPLSKP